MIKQGLYLDVLANMEAAARPASALARTAFAFIEALHQHGARQATASIVEDSVRSSVLKQAARKPKRRGLVQTIHRVHKPTR